VDGGAPGQPKAVRTVADFERSFGKIDPAMPLTVAVRDFFVNGGTSAIVVRVDDADYAPALTLLDTLSRFGVLCVLPASGDEDVPPEVWQAALDVCIRRHAFLIVDPPSGWKDAGSCDPADLGMATTGTENAAVYFPRLEEDDDVVLPSGAVAGVMARTEAQDGIWKSPAGRNAVLRGISALQVMLTDEEGHSLNEASVNVLRSFPGTGNVVWGARTLCRTCGTEYKYIAVRRLALWIETNLEQGLQWAAFEPDDEPLWQKIRTQATAFLNDLYVQGAFMGSSPNSAYFVKCDRTTTTQADIAQGIANVVVGFAPVRPAEFTVLTIVVQTQ